MLKHIQRINQNKTDSNTVDSRDNVSIFLTSRKIVTTCISKYIEKP